VSGARKAPSDPPASGPAGSPASPGTGAPTGPHSAAPQPQTYEAAAARVEEIIKRLDSGEASLNETLELVSEGKALIELCARQLAAVGDALEELRLDELVSRLESEASG
jgi:exodeoxyribonuclease VII small subunit